MQLIKGRVIHGQKYGRKIGYKTANLVAQNLNIQYGVWVTRVFYNNIWLDAISYFSVNSSDQKIFESHIFDFDKEIYDEDIQVKVIQFLREPINFDSEELLIQQMQKDCIKAKAILK